MPSFSFKSNFLFGRIFLIQPLASLSSPLFSKILVANGYVAESPRFNKSSFQSVTGNAKSIKQKQCGYDVDLRRILPAAHEKLKNI